MRVKHRLTLESKVVFIDFEENKGEKELRNKTLEWFIEQMSITNRRKDISFGEWFIETDVCKLDTDGKITSVVYALVSGLCGVHEYDDIGYRVENNTIYIDRFSRFHEDFFKKLKKNNES